MLVHFECCGDRCLIEKVTGVKNSPVRVRYMDLLSNGRPQGVYQTGEVQARS
jgi:hypothetical protein